MDEQDLAFDDAGTGPAVILLHGYPFDRSMWRDQIRVVVAAGYRAIAPDLRGLGESAFAGETTTMGQMARDVLVLMSQLEVDRATVCGLSMGGYVALEFAQLFPSRLNALILAGTRAPADSEEEKQGRQQQVELMLTKGMKPVAEGSLMKLLALITLEEKPEVVAGVRRMILQSNPHGAAAAQRGMAARRDYSSDLPRINVPALIIVGREDTIRPVSDAGFMHDRIPGSRLEIIDAAAHMTNMEQPEIFNRALLKQLIT